MKHSTKKLLPVLIMALGVFTSSAVYAAGVTNPPSSGTGGSAGATTSMGDKLQGMYDSYSKFDYGDSMNWSDCFNFELKPGIDMCPGGTIYPPYPTPTLEYEYYDVVAMVEVVHDPWRSFLYDESFYDFESKADSALASSIGVKPGLGGGYGKRQGGGNEFQAQQKMETHVWAVSDWWRLKTSDTVDACLSLTCKNKDLTGCLLSVKNIVSNLGGDVQSITGSINQGTVVNGKGQMIVDEEAGTVSYEDGSVYEEREVMGPNGPTGEKEYVMTRPPGNFGYAGVGESAGATIDRGAMDSAIPGASSGINDLRNEIVSSDVWKEGTAAYNEVNQGITDVQDSMTDAWNNSSIKSAYDSTVSEIKGTFTSDEGLDTQISDQNKNDPMPGSGTYSVPPETVTHQQAPEQRSEFTQAPGSESLSEYTSDLSANAFGSNAPGKENAASQIESQVAGATANMGSAALEQAMAVIDRIQYFSVIEQAIQMVATVSPIMIHPVYMSERHEDAAAEGGFFMSKLYSKVAEMGAGLIMPMFCAAQVVTDMAPQALASMMGVDIDWNVLNSSFVQSFINARCVGSWGPLEPRVNLLGVGDEMVAAGLASARGLDIAQNITGDMYNKTINNTPIKSLMFNLDWPHRSSCYGFNGGNGGLSRAWTTPVEQGIDGILEGVKNGDGAGIAGTVGKNTAGNVVKQGGYVFTYWRKRKCRYLLLCDKWRGDTGL
jgi:hypothetical protein